MAIARSAYRERRFVCKCLPTTTLKKYNGTSKYPIYFVFLDSCSKL